MLYLQPNMPKTVRALKKGAAKSKKENTGKDKVPKVGSVEEEIQKFLKEDIRILKAARKRALPGSTRSIEDIWKEADREYPPHTLGAVDGKEGDIKHYEQDQETGYRSRMVRVGEDEGWQSDDASNDFYVKVQTAQSILIDQNPEAVFFPAERKYEATTRVAYANWKSGWEMSGAKKELKKFMFNGSKYGTAFARTFPYELTMRKKISDDEVREITKYKGLKRENLNPWKVWVSESARPGDPDSIDSWYFEKEYSIDRFKAEFGDLPNAKVVPDSAKPVKDGDEGGSGDQKEREQPSVIVGFYENQVKDLQAKWLPDYGRVLESSPLRNDEGHLSLWMSPWTLRHDECIYGIGVYEIIKNDLNLYNRLVNMTMDQLVLSIYKMFFYSGVNMGEEGKLTLAPGVGEPMTDPKAINFLEVPGPGAESWRGMQFLIDRKDTSSGIPQQLSGKFAGKTLGQDLQAKEAALERMKGPLDYVLDALATEAYLSLSWQKQMLSIPEVLVWNNQEDLQAALGEAGLEEAQVAEYMKVLQNPNDKRQNELYGQEDIEEEGEMVQKKYAFIYPEIALKLERGENAELIESDDQDFFRYGLDISLWEMDWKGIIRILPQSVLKPSKELAKRSTLDLFNLVFPSIQAMATTPQLVPVLISPIERMIRVYDHDPRDWINKEVFMQMYEATKQPPPEEKKPPSVSVSVNISDLGQLDKNGQKNKFTPAQKQMLEKFFGIKIQEPLLVDSEGGGEQEAGMVDSGATEGGPGGEGPLPPEFSTKSGIEAPQVADIGDAPTTESGAVEGSERAF